MINEKGVVKNVIAARAHGLRAGVAAPAASRRGALATTLLAAILPALVATATVLGAALPTAASAQPSGLGQPIALSSLPPEARQAQQRILAGGPFPYARDGVVFGNRERRLERQPRGYYHEYTVPTPGARNRGARRIICGGARPTEPDACFYTEDHYNSFHRIVK